MALFNTEKIASQVRGLASMPLLRQAGLVVGLAATVSIGVAIVLWSQEPVFRQLYGNLSDADSSEVVAALQTEGIEYRINERTGAVLVPARRLHETRISLAAAGLPKGSGVGFELLEEKSAFGDSEFMETARYQRALEGELGRTIESLADVRGVRVHLALTKRSLFLRDREKPSASVLVNLHPGRTLAPNQAQAIVHLVSSSVPELERGRVTVIDQNGRLLSTREGEDQLQLSMGQFDYSRRLEEAYTRRIEEILTPILGAGRVRAQVMVDVDFTLVESTEELYEPDPNALRSEQITEQRTEGSPLPVGIPGALSNQPPAGGSVNPAGGAGGGSPVSTSSNAVRNFELDRKVRHVRSPTGVVKRLSAAVVVDDVIGTDEDGNPVTKPLSPEELKNLDLLVKKAIGFDEERNDSLHIVNASFQAADMGDPASETSFLERPWLWEILKQLGGLVLVVLLVFGVLRPVMRGLAEKGGKKSPEQAVLADASSPGGLPAPDELPPDRLSVSSEGAGPLGQLAAPQDYAPKLSKAQSVVNEDPKLAANLVREWLTE